MRGLVHSPLFLRLGARMRGPDSTPPGSMKRIILSNIVSSGAVAEYPSIISGIPGALIEDIKISDVYLQQVGGGSKDWAALDPRERKQLSGSYHVWRASRAWLFLAPHTQP